MADASIVTIFRRLSPRMRTLVGASVGVTTGIFALNPLFVTELPAWSHLRVPEISRYLLVAVIVGSALSYAVTTRANVDPVRAYRVALGLFAFALIALLTSHVVPVPWVAVLAGMLAYRIAIGLYYATSRVLYLTNKRAGDDYKDVSVIIEASNNAGAALGPALSATLLASLAFAPVLAAIELLFATAAVLGWRVGSGEAASEPAAAPAQAGRPRRFDPTTAAFFAAILMSSVIMAQTITFIPLTLQHLRLPFAESLGTFYTVGALYVVVLGPATVKLASRLVGGDVRVFALGIVVMAGTLALIGRSHVIASVAVTSLLFSGGSVLTATSMFSLASRIGRSGGSVMKTYAQVNVVTNALGLACGQYLGTAAVSWPGRDVLWLGIAALGCAAIVTAGVTGSAAGRAGGALAGEPR